MASRRRGRSTRSYVIEMLFAAGALLVLYLWLTNGGPAWLGQWFADAMINSRQ